MFFSSFVRCFFSFCNNVIVFLLFFSFFSLLVFFSSFLLFFSLYSFWCGFTFPLVSPFPWLVCFMVFILLFFSFSFSFVEVFFGFSSSCFFSSWLW